MRRPAKDLVLFPNAMVCAIVAGGVIAGTLYFAYKRGRVDEIDELCNIVRDRGELEVAFHHYGKLTNVILKQA